MKKILSVFLCLTAWLSASAYDFEVDGIYYNITGNGDIDMTSCPNGIYVIIDGKGGILKINR